MNIEIIPLQSHGDERGSLIALEEGKNIPFQIKRVYYIYQTKENVRRGYHAHYSLKQLVIAVKGSCRFVLDNGKEKVEIFLDNPSQGLLIDSCVWREMYDFSDDCVLMVLADQLYDEKDYIRDYESFLKITQEK